jgi:D-sedoheptulose 7-phosphate isomerase
MSSVALPVKSDGRPNSNSVSSSADTLRCYFDEVACVAERLDAAIVDVVVKQIVLACQRGATIHILGNGGSAATASHFACDLAKNASPRQGPKVRALALTDSVPLLTALANDDGYESVFAEQLSIHARPGDIVIVISGSGNSRNILAALDCAHSLRLTTIGLLGFEGGRAAALVDEAIIVPASCIQVVEDAHSLLSHAISVAVRGELARDG